MHLDKNLLFHKFVELVASVHREKHEMTRNVKPANLTSIQYNILEYITISQPVTISDISDCQHISMPNTSRELKKLLEKNLIEKFEDTEDRRKQYIQLSNHGKEVMEHLFSLIEKNFSQKMRNMSTDELIEMDKAMELLLTKWIR